MLFPAKEDEPDEPDESEEQDEDSPGEDDDDVALISPSTMVTSVA